MPTITWSTLNWKRWTYAERNIYNLPASGSYQNGCIPDFVYSDDDIWEGNDSDPAVKEATSFAI